MKRRRWRVARTRFHLLDAATPGTGDELTKGLEERLCRWVFICSFWSGMERKMKSSVGLCLALEPEMETKVELTRLNRLDHQRRCFTLNPLTLTVKYFIDKDRPESQEFNWLLQTDRILS